ncbi:hypothetical protein V6N13_099295 [Hibiscus sabdariffa]
MEGAKVTKAGHLQRKAGMIAASSSDGRSYKEVLEGVSGENNQVTKEVPKVYKEGKDIHINDSKVDPIVKLSIDLSLSIEISIEDMKWSEDA